MNGEKHNGEKHKTEDPWAPVTVTAAGYGDEQRAWYIEESGDEVAEHLLSRPQEPARQDEEIDL